MNIILAILGFSLLIIVHELGHFALAKFNGVKVDEFSIGMGPEIFSRKGKETQYSLRLFPIGGYVKMLGEESDVDDERSFSNKHPLRRMSIILAGAFMNIVFAIVVFAMIFSKVGFSEPIVNTVLEDSPALTAGLQSGDRILRVNGSKVYTSSDVSVDIQLAKGKEVTLQVDRAGQKQDIKVKPALVEDNGQQVYRVGFSYTSNTDPTIPQILKHTLNETVSVVGQTYKSLQMMITGKVNFKTDVGGPVTIIKMSSQAAKNGIMTLGYFLAFISVNLAVFNLLPFPALDGGWTVILFIELITRRKVPDKIVGALNYVGFMVLIGFMVLVTLKDIIFPVKF